MPRPRNAFTLVELLIVIAIIGLLVSLGVPAIMAARQSALRTQCANHQWQIGRAFHQRIAVLNRTPPAKVVAKQLGPYMENSEAVFKCPAEEVAGVAYAVNKRVQKIKIGDSNMKIVLVDGNEPYVDFVSNDDAWRSIIEPRHFSTLNVLYYDGHVESKLAADLDNYIQVNPATTPHTIAEQQAAAEQILEDVRDGRMVWSEECPMTGLKVENRFPITLAGVSLGVCCAVCQEKVMSASPAERIRMIFNNDNGVWVSR